MNDPSHTYPFHCHGTGNQATLFVKVDRWSADTNCKSDKDCPGSYCMDDPTKTKPFNCHAEAPSGETVLYSVINRNHCQEVHVANSQFKGFWDAVGNWKYAHYARGECPPQFNTKDSIKHDVNWPTAMVIKKGIAASFLRNDPTNGNECCGVPCDDTSECSANMFCCPNHHECMDTSTGSTEGPNCDAARDNGCQSTGTAEAVMKVLRGDHKKAKVLHVESKTHCSEVHIPASEYKAFMADKGWSLKAYKRGNCEAAWNNKEQVTRDAKYKGVYYVKRGKKAKVLRNVFQPELGVCSICEEAVKGLVAAAAGGGCGAACAATGCEPCIPYCASICGSIAAGETNAEWICAHIDLC